MGVVGVPGVRVRTAEGRGAGVFQLVVEDRPEPGDEVRESRGIRFFLDAQTASALAGAVLDLEGLDLVFRRP